MEYKVLSRQQNAGQNHDIKIGNEFFLEVWQSYNIWGQLRQIKFHS